MYSVPRVRFSLICIDYLAYSIIVSVLPLSTHWFLPTRLVESSNDYRVTRKTQDSTLHHTTPHSLVFFFFFSFFWTTGEERAHAPEQCVYGITSRRHFPIHHISVARSPSWCEENVLWNSTKGACWSARCTTLIPGSWLLNYAHFLFGWLLVYEVWVLKSFFSIS